MREFTFMQNIFIDAPEYAQEVSVLIPEASDIPEEFRAAVSKYCAVKPVTIVEQLSICSTPITKAGLNPVGEAKLAVEILYKLYKVSFIAG